MGENFEPSKFKSWLLTGFVILTLAVFLFLVGLKLCVTIQYLKAQRDYYEVLVKYHNDILIPEAEMKDYRAE